MSHYSVLKEESIFYLNLKEDGIYVDATLGRAGHSLEILKKNKKGHLYAFDLDMEAICESKKKLDQYGNHYTIFHSNYSQMKKCLKDEKIFKVDGILMDLGVSSPMFDNPERGFSYRYDAKLDMRMDKNQELSAYEVVNFYSVEELSKIFREYGEEKFAYKIALNIVKERETKQITTTFELVEIIKKSLPAAILNKKKHPAKKVFQAIRIEVNKELDNLKLALKDALELLDENGRLCVITFHSLEDRIVKNIFNEVAKPKKQNKRLPQEEEKLKFHLVSKKPIIAKESELLENNRSHSAKLRVIERITL